MKKYSPELLIFLIVVAVMNAIFMSPAFRLGSIEREAAAQLGDFVGGYVGTFVSLISVLLLVRTLRNQQAYEATEHFEDRYYELLRLHRENVSEMRLQGEEGRRVFVLILNEFNESIESVQGAAHLLGKQFPSHEVIELAYYLVYFGTGKHATPMLKAAIAGTWDEQFMDHLTIQLEARKEVARRRVRQGERTHVPFEGHQSRLGHYYRHLFQLVTYVDQQRLDIDKYEYVRTIRAQLSTHEQALLFINSVTRLGQNWWKRDLVKKYRLVKNVPQEFFDASLCRLESHFEDGYFEWQGVRNSPWSSPLASAAVSAAPQGGGP